MIEEKQTYTKDEVQQLLKWQHINTVNKILMTEPWRQHDYWERVEFGDIDRAIKSVRFTVSDIRVDEYNYKFKASDN